MHLRFAEPKAEPSKSRDRAWLLSMPRARGWPRRGAAWYAADSRRKRQKNFEKALALASRRKTRKSRRLGMPPMVYVEEIAPGESIQSYNESLLFTVPDNWNPPAYFGKDAVTPAPSIVHSPRDAPVEEFTACFVEEEFLKGMEENIEEFTTGEPPEVVKQRNRQIESLGGNAKERKDVADQPPFLHPEHLELIFDIRSMVDDQIFRAIRINQRLDMIYAAYSSASPRRQCPTCAQVYTIPVKRGKNGDEDKNTG
jgi:hypothetical protein